MSFELIVQDTIFKNQIESHEIINVCPFMILSAYAMPICKAILTVWLSGQTDVICKSYRQFTFR
jgi:hypothetical protein